MPILPIKLVGEHVLRTKARPVDLFDSALSRLIDDMLDTMYKAPGIGLAAPQIGVSKRIIVVDIGDGPIRMCNPKMVQFEGEQVGLEGCLSIPELFGDVKRFERIVVKGMDDYGKPFRIEAQGLLSRCFQHEIDHLDGRLFTDLALNLHERRPSTSGEDDEEEEEGQEESVEAEVGA